MALAEENIVRSFLDVQAGVPIDVDITVFETVDIRVFFGIAGLEASLGVDFQVVIDPTFSKFTLTPQQSLIDKIDDLIANDDTLTERNKIVVRRLLDYETVSTPDRCRRPDFVSREFDRNAMRDQQLDEGLSQTLRFNNASTNNQAIDAVPNRLLGFDSQGDIAYYPLTFASLTDVNVKYIDVNALKLSAEAERGVGARWEAGYFVYEELPATANTFYIQNAAGVKLRPLAYPASSFFCEMVGDSDTVLRDLFNQMPAGHKIVLEGRTYTSVGFDWVNNPLVPSGEDTAKVIEGSASAAQRYQTTGEFFGTRIVLAAGQNRDLFSMGSVGANKFGSGGLRNVMLDGNKAGNSAGSGVFIDDIKDLEFHNVLSWNFAENGFNYSGANNQINLTGFIEAWNNTIDGIRGGAIGDAQCNAAVRCVNNGRHGFYMAAGQGRYDQLYSYFNGARGIWLAPAVDQHFYCKYARTEDNDLEGLRVDAKRAHFGHIEASDNGAATVVNSERAGVVLSSNCKSFQADRISSSDRASDVTHNQRNLLYVFAGASGHIEVLDDGAFGAHGIAGEQSILNPDSDKVSGITVGHRPPKLATFAEVGTVIPPTGPDIESTFKPKPDSYGSYEITDCPGGFILENTTTNASCEGMRLELKVTVSAPTVIQPQSQYKGLDGLNIPDISVNSAGQSARLSLKQTGGFWFLTAPVVVE